MVIGIVFIIIAIVALFVAAYDASKSHVVRYRDKTTVPKHVKTNIGSVRQIDRRNPQKADRLRLVETLNPQQQKAVEFKGKHLLVLAGAGTGKTKTIIERAKYLINNGVDARRIIILSFTRKSANEIAYRIKTGIDGEKTAGLSGSTFHSWCMGILKSNPRIFPQHNWTVLDEDDRDSCFKLMAGKNFKKQTGVTPKNILDVYSFSVNKMCSLPEAIKSKLLNDDTLEQDEEKEIDSIGQKIERLLPVFNKVIGAYNSYKEVHRYIDYDDILNIVSKRLKNDVEVRDYISSKYDHILVDEMQDTNPLQYELLSSYYGNCHLFCVGDDAQSIYAFRGADFKTIHAFTEVVPESESCKLTLNYRSTQEILDLSNWLLKQSPLNYGKELVADRGNGVIPQILHWRSEWHEADDITGKIIDSISESGLCYSDNMVLSRSMWGLRTVEGMCMNKKIPYVIFGGIGLMKSRHIRDVVSALRIVANHRDELAWMRYLQLWKGIGPVSAARVIEKCTDGQSLEDCLVRLKSMSLQDEIYNILINVKDIQTNVPLAIQKSLTGMSKRLKEIYGEEWVWRVKDFDVLKEVARSTGSISEFISEYVLDPKLETTVMKQNSGDDDAVILSTIHSAKGLEASNCYVVNASPGNWPTLRSFRQGEDSIEEERRCLYVALTRAKDRLFIYRDMQSIHSYISEDKYVQSYFLNGVPKRLYKSVIMT